MVTLAQRITELREERGMSRPALAQALGFPKPAIEKFETGRLTPSQEQQQKLADFFEVSLFYLQGKGRDRTRMEDWLSGMEPAVELDGPTPTSTRPAPKLPAPVPAAAQTPSGQGNLFDSLLTSKKFQEVLTAAILEALRSPAGQEVLTQVVQKELNRQR